MITKFGGEVPAIDKAIEGASEVIQILCKIKRFGFNNYNPQTGIPNYVRLKEEMQDLVDAVTSIYDEN